MKNNNWSYSEKVRKMAFTKRHQEQVLRNLGTTKRKKNSRKRIISGVTAVALFAMLALSTIFAPVMENVLAKIPYISQFVEDEEQKMEKWDTILNQVTTIVEKNDLELRNINIFDREMSVKIFLNKLPENEEKIIVQIQTEFNDTGLNGYEVSVVVYEEEEIKTEQSQEEIELAMQNNQKLEEALTERLQLEEYELMFPVSVRITQGSVYMNVIVPKTEERIDQLKEILKDEAKDFGNNYELDVRQVEKIAREQEKRWEKTGAIGDIGGALTESTEFPVTGFAYSFHPYPLEIIVKTSLSRDDSESSQVAENIRAEIDLYIQNDEDTETIRNDEYDVKVLSEDKKEIK
ncbi:DUF4030 domain-containing protein [Bacillus hwajinpoensis]|uniref:DUF4030 domain-containing protein n=1 Tax=Guptibacillus hwajinpoensis TaxID=208199 RepID=A0A845EXX8_9BACL|nr:hypothetical protein [Pseudalkalibacillus hwajinpoensis]MYL63442.1 DUF4030 domain-containing protein [Pseudalkalibacillus hwajinpoensis]